jgi:hypothetical protein
MEPIQTPIQEPVQIPVQVPTSQNKTNWVMIVLLILSTILLILTVFLSLQNQQLKKQVLNPQVSPTVQVLFPTPKTSSSISISPDKTTNWKTYVNEKFRYSVKYPNDWTYREFPDTQTGAGFRPLDKPNEVAYEVINIDFSQSGLNSQNVPFEDYVKRVAIDSIQNYESLNTIDKIITQTNEVGYITTWNVLPLWHPGPTTSAKEVSSISLPRTYFNTKDSQGDLIVISLNNENYLNVYKLILPTFEFVK